MAPLINTAQPNIAPVAVAPTTGVAQASNALTPQMSAPASQTAAPSTTPVATPSPQMGTAPQPNQQQQVAQIITQARQQGVPDEQIFQTLHDNGMIPTNAVVQPGQDQGVGGFAGAALGAEKGALGTLNNLSSLGQDFLSNTAGRVSNFLLGKGFNPTDKADLGNVVDLQAHGTAENVGKIGEQVGEFFIPGLDVADGAKAANAAIDTLDLASKYGKAGEVAANFLKQYGTKAALEGVKGGTLAGVQSNSLSEGVKSGLLFGGTDAALTGLGKGFEALTSGKSLSPFAKGYNSDLAKIAEERGIQLPASALTDSKVAQTAESIAAKGFFGGKLVDMVNSAGEKINQLAEDTIKTAGGTPDPLKAGSEISDSLTKFKDNWQTVKNKLYDEANALSDGKVEVNLDKTKELLQQTIEQKTKASSATAVDTGLSFFKEQLAKLERKPGTLAQGTDFVTNEAGMTKAAPLALSPPKTPVMLDEARAALKEINQKINFNTDPVVTGNKALMRKFAATFEGDIDASMPDTMQSAIKKANSYYKQGLETLNSEFGKKITKFAEQGQPDKIIPAIMGPNASLADIPKILQTVGENNANSIRRSVLTQIFEDARSLQNGEFTAAGLGRQIGKYGEDNLKALLKPEQFKALADIEKLSNGLKMGQKIADGSQTAFIGRLMASGAALFANPTAAITAILGDAAYGKFISSEAGQNLLKGGIKLDGGVGKAIQGSTNSLKIKLPVTAANVISRQSSTKIKMKN